jgi:hypothetical protein
VLSEILHIGNGFPFGDRLLPLGAIAAASSCWANSRSATTFLPPPLLLYALFISIEKALLYNVIPSSSFFFSG